MDCWRLPLGTLSLSVAHQSSRLCNSGLSFAAAACRHGGEAADVASVAVGIITDLLNMTINW
jgi:hypothetical protein